jgi:effector-binding domain-containing protein
MSEELNVRYVDLPDMTVATALGFGTEPEIEAAKLLNVFTRRLGFTPGSPGHPLYGFNNPNPSPGSKNYGYELWCKVDPNTKPEPPVKIKHVPPARYAVTRFTGLSNIGRVWRQFAAWVEDHHSQVPPCTIQCWLESLQTPDEPDPERWVMDLYIVVGEASES